MAEHFKALQGHFDTQFHCLTCDFCSISREGTSVKDVSHFCKNGTASHGSGLGASSRVLGNTKLTLENSNNSG